MYEPTLRLKNKVVIVTGAGCVGPGWGNGRAISVRFAQEGAHVFAVDISMDAMIETPMNEYQPLLTTMSNVRHAFLKVWTPKTYEAAHRMYLCTV